MADSQAFTKLCEALEAESSFDRLEARGTVRIALKQAGLEVGSVTRSQIQVVIDKILPGELSARGVDDADTLCRKLHGMMDSVADSDDGADRPEDVFERLGG